MNSNFHKRKYVNAFINFSKPIIGVINGPCKLIKMSKFI